MPAKDYCLGNRFYGAERLAVRLLALMKSACVIFLCFAHMPSGANGKVFHISSTGKSQASGTMSDPWSLPTALMQSVTVHPGDTMWIHGGVYRLSAPLSSSLWGTPGRPVIVRNYRGERVTLEGTFGGASNVFYAGGAFTWYWGLEIRSTTMDTLGNCTLVNVSGQGLKFINCVIHDGTGAGFADFSAADETEIYGCLVYFNGRRTVGNHNYGIYAQNDGKRKVYEDNFWMHNFGLYQVHCYGSAGLLDSFYIKHNVFTNWSNAAALTIGAEDSAARFPVVDSNYFYGSGGGGEQDLLRLLFIEYGAGCRSPVIRGNYFMRGMIVLNAATTNRVFVGNTTYGRWPYLTTWSVRNVDFDTAGAPRNQWHLSRDYRTVPRPRGTTVSVRSNRYEQGRANVVIYNWEKLPKVSVDLSEVLRVGDRFEVRDAQNFYGAPTATGTYEGGSVSIPMVGLPIAAPISYPGNLARPQHTPPEFAAFVVTTVPSVGASEVLVPRNGGSRANEASNK